MRAVDVDLDGGRARAVSDGEPDDRQIAKVANKPGDEVTGSGIRPGPAENLSRSRCRGRSGT
ncbi:hypothetical protein [Streptomyces sp. HC307]|uniref:hypothetical protein n=1 Tax=Streptomyces flavusporus TaxID=3385496 RepID=UPI003916DDFF